jgi:Mrp family chromosome partitioning ATPase
MTSAPEIWKPSSTDQVERSPGRSSRIFSPASVEGDSEPQRPSFLQSRRRSDAPPFLATAQANASPTAPPVPTHASDTAPSEQSAAGLINRLRRSLSPSQGAPEALPPAPKSAWLERLRASKPTPEAIKADKFDTAVMSTPGDIMPTLSTNDLRAYLNQRLASRGTEAANDPIRKSDAIPSKVEDKAQPLLKSLGAVINDILASGNGGAPRALLVVGASPKVDATSEAIRIARVLVAKGERIVLVDLTRGPAAISGPLGIPRSPGLSDLAAGRAGFEDIVRVDVETPLQVIAAGNPKLAASGDENGRFSRVFDALTQAYDCVVLHADREAVRALTPALKFELPLVIAVLPAGAGASNDKAGLADFAALGCPVMVYEQSAKQPRSRLFGRVAVG